MKKLGFGIILMAALMFGCTDPTFENSVENITVVRSEQVLEMDRDTVVVTIDETRVYVIEDEKVSYEARLVGKNTVDGMLVGDLLFIIFLVAIVGFLIARAILD